MFPYRDISWFAGGKLNICFNCVDRHIQTRCDTYIYLQVLSQTLYSLMHANLFRSNQTAFIWEGDEPGQNKYITYSELLKDICRIANVFKAKGVRKGDVVTIYMPMIPQ